MKALSTVSILLLFLLTPRGSLSGSGSVVGGGAAGQSQTAEGAPVLAQWASPASTPAPIGDIEVGPAVGDFGDVSVGAYAEKRFYISVHRIPGGPAQAPLLHVGTISITGLDASLFQITADFASGETLYSVEDGGWGKAVDVRFAPLSPGTKTASLAIPSDDVDESVLYVDLYGVGRTSEEPDISIFPTSIDFGEEIAGMGGGATRAITVFNEGKADLKVDTLRFSGRDVLDFRIERDTLSGDTLEPGWGATIYLYFAPLSPGSKTAQLVIPSNDPNESVVTVDLEGVATSSTGEEEPSLLADLTGHWSKSVGTDARSLVILAAKGRRGEGKRRGRGKGGPLRTQLIVKNVGEGDAGAFQIGYYLSTDRFRDAGDAYKGFSAYSGLAAGKRLKNRFRVRRKRLLSYLYILAEIDDANEVSESNEFNNEVSFGPLGR